MATPSNAKMPSGKMFAEAARLYALGSTGIANDMLGPAVDDYYSAPGIAVRRRLMQLVKAEKARPQFKDDLKEYRFARRVVNAVRTFTQGAFDLRPDHYRSWLGTDRDDAKEYAQFDRAVKSILPPSAYNDGEALARLDNMLLYVLGLASADAGGVKFKSSLKAAARQHAAACARRRAAKVKSR